MTQLSLLGELAWKGTVILAAAFLAAARHFLWTEALAALLLLPAVMAVAPRWKVQPAMKTTGATATAAPTVLVVRPESAPPFTPPWLLLWAVGCGVVGIRLAMGKVPTRRILRRARIAHYAQEPGAEIAGAIGIRRKVAVLEAADAPIPLACGL